MTSEKSKVLVLVEGEKTDVKLMEHLFNIYGIEKSHTIVSYNTNIYTLYNEMFAEDSPESIDLLQLLKSREKDEQRKLIFDERYSDILLIFDLDPHDPLFSEKKIRDMSKYFVESSDMGKLYINYPMVEAFYHMESIPDQNYNSRYATMDELRAKQYKQRVNLENRNHSYSKFAVDKKECSTVILQNIEKAFLLCGAVQNDMQFVPDSEAILNVQLNTIEREDKMAVLCTCVFYISEYNPNLLKS